MLICKKFKKNDNDKNINIFFWLYFMSYLINFIFSLVKQQKQHLIPLIEYQQISYPNIHQGRLLCHTALNLLVIKRMLMRHL